MLVCSGQDSKAVATLPEEPANGAPSPATPGPAAPSAAAATLPEARAGASGTLPEATGSGGAIKPAGKLPLLPAGIIPPVPAGLQVSTLSLQMGRSDVQRAMPAFCGPKSHTIGQYLGHRC